MISKLSILGNKTRRAAIVTAMEKKRETRPVVNSYKLNAENDRSKLIIYTKLVALVNG